MTVAHSTLTGANLHEPKGVDSANADQVYVSDGAGSGDWTDVSTVVAIGAWNTGDVRATIRTTAASGWVLMNDGTIGSASSGATTRANADTEDLYTLLWNNISDTYAAVSGGRGASAAADWASNKAIALPKMLGRVLGGYGTGSGLTARVLGETAGAETVTLATANLPAHNHGVTDPGHTHSISGTASVGFSNQNNVFENGTNFSGARFTGSTSVSLNLSNAANTTGITTQNTGSGTAHANVQPTTFLNFEIKL